MAESELAPKFAPFFGMVRMTGPYKTGIIDVLLQGGIAFAVSGLNLLPLMLPSLMHCR